MKWKSIICAFGITLAGWAWAVEPGVTLGVQEPWSGLFAGQEQVYHVAGGSAGSFEGRLVWEFSASGGVIDRGEQALSDHAASAAIRLRVPPVKPGVVMQGTLTTSFVPAGQDREASKNSRAVWLFSREPFAGKTAWLEGLRLRVFDPVGKTAALFVKEKLPFAEIRNADVIAGLTDGVLVIGEGLSFRDYRGLFESAVKAAAAGVDVLILAPEGGEVALPVAAAPELPLPGRLAFRGLDVISSLDKRLDDSGWAPDGRLVGSSLAIRGERGPVVGEVRKDSAGWPWMEIKPARGSGSLTLCGLALVAKWEDSPVPRYLFLRLLETTAPSGKKGE